MKHNYFVPRHAAFLFALFTFLFIAGIRTEAQVASYAFTQSTTTYTPITGGTLIIDSTYGADDDNFTANPIGFSFYFNGNTYTDFGLNSNGFIWFGAGEPSTSTYDAINNSDPALDGTPPVEGVIAPLHNDLIQRSSFPSGEVSVQTIGSSPNRICVIQFANWRGYGLGTDAVYNYQIRLYETSNTVQFVYGNFVTTGVTANSDFEVGLRGTSNSDFNNREITTDWATSTAGTSSAANATIDVTTYPASGLTFTWTAPNCLSPGGIATTALTPTSTSITWTAANGAPLGYIWKVVASGAGSGGTALAGGYVLSPADSVATGNVLAANTAYDVFVRTVCSATDTSGWGQLSFSTPCFPLNTPWTEGFETGPSYGYGLFPSCWSGSGDWETDTLPGSNNRGARTGRGYLYTAYSADDWAYTPPLDLTAGTKYQFSFWYRTDEYTWDTLAAAVGMGQSVSAMTTMVGTAVTAFSDTTYKQYIGYFTPATSGIYYFGVHVVADFAPYYIDFDDFNVDVAPTCTPSSALTATAISSTSEALNWTETGTATKWQVQYGAFGFALGTGTLKTANSKPDTLSGLTPSTTYSYYVRSLCSVGDTSAWSGPFTFTTLCGPASLPWAEGFETLSAYGAGVFPNCWSGTGDWNTDTVPGTNMRGARTGKGYLYTKYDAADWAYTPSFSLTAGNWYQLSFWYKTDGLAGWDTLYAAAGTSQTAAAMTNLVGTAKFNINDTVYTQYTGTFSPSVTGTYNFGVYVSASFNPWYIDFDDFNVRDVTASYHDISVVSVILPAQTCGGTALPVKVVVKNNGAVTETNVPVKVNVSGAVTLSLLDTIASIAGGKYDTITVGTLNTTDGGNYVVKGISSLINDVKTNNDSLADVTYIYAAIPKETHTVTSVKCFGDTTGLINVTLTGTGLTSHWSNGDTTKNLINVGAGSYTDTVTSQAGCKAVFGPFTVSQPASAISVTSVVTSQTQNGAKGAINITATGGTAPYKYKWTTNDSTEDLSNLNAGNYKVTVTDVNGCKAERTDSVKFIVSGIEDVDGVNLYTVYPNPNTGKFYVSLEMKNATDMELEIININGQLIKSMKESNLIQHTFEIDMTDQAAGIYVAKITSGDKVITRKISINK